VVLFNLHIRKGYIHANSVSLDNIILKSYQHALTQPK